MAVAYPSRMKVFLETPEGLVHEITGYVSEISMTCQAGEAITTTLEIIGNEGITTFNNIGFYEKVEGAKKRGEWKCDYCGHVNPMSARNCGGEDRSSVGCGAVRSFVYGNKY